MWVTEKNKRQKKYMLAQDDLFAKAQMAEKPWFIDMIPV